MKKKSKKAKKRLKKANKNHQQNVKTKANKNNKQNVKTKESKDNKQNGKTKENKDNEQNNNIKENKNDEQKDKTKENKNDGQNDKTKANKNDEQNNNIKENKNDEQKDKTKENKNDGQNDNIKANKNDEQNDKTKEQKNDEQNDNSKKIVKNVKSKSFSKIIIVIFILIMLLETVYGGYLLFEKYKKKFKSIDIEIGTSEKVTMYDFLKDTKYAENSKLITNLDDIDYSKVGEYKVLLSHDDREEEVTLSLIDTTAPTVQFQNISRYIDYVPNADDFIVKKEDLSEMTAELIDLPAITEFHNYDIKVVVRDASGNETSNICNLSIQWIKDSLLIERGQEIKKEDLLFNVEKDGDLLDINRLKEISNSEIGEYEIVTTKDGIEKKTIIKVTDLTPPTLELRNVTIYDDEKVNGKDSFIVSAKDASGEVTTTMKTEINYSKLGTQEIVIEAVDKYGNKTEKTAILTRHKDNVGPVFSGLSNISVTKGAKINYEQGVSAKDEKDGVCEFQVDSSSVNTGVAGTYYATYTSKDTKGNTTTKKRKIVINHDRSDVNALVKSIASELSSNVEQIRDYVRNKISYGHSYGDGDPVWYGFTNWTGNCYVHACCFQELLRIKGYETQLIWVTNKTHYWNLVKINGVWRHMDSTPDRNHRKISIMTDSQRLSTLSGRDWDHSAWPAAN